MKKVWRNRITNQCREDYRQHVNRIVTKIELAVGKRDHSAVYRGVTELRSNGNNRKASRAPAKN